MYIMEIIPIIGIIKYQYYGDNNIMIGIITSLFSYKSLNTFIIVELRGLSYHTSRPCRNSHISVLSTNVWCLPLARNTNHTIVYQSFDLLAVTSSRRIIYHNTIIYTLVFVLHFLISGDEMSSITPDLVTKLIFEQI